MSRHLHVHVHDAPGQSTYAPGQNPASHAHGPHSGAAHQALLSRGFNPVGNPAHKVEYHQNHPSGDPKKRRAVSVVPHSGSRGGHFWNSSRGGRVQASGEGNESLERHIAGMKDD